MSGLNEWDQIDQEGKEEISLADMDQALCTLRAMKEEYTHVDKLAKEAYAKVKEQETKIIDMLKKSGKGTYITEGVGKATIVEKLSVPTPKTPEEKRAFFDWIANNLGEDARDAYMTVNSSTLNKFYEEQTELAAARGEVLQIDGLDAPTSRSTLSFRKA